jgi:RND family efflux transporter MFP subunit
VEPGAQAALSFKTSGTLGEIATTVGETVQSGQVLALLDPSSLNASLLGAEADIIAAQQALDDLLEGSSEQQIAQAVMALAEARDAMKEAETKWTNQQAGYRANSTTIRAAEAELALAKEAMEIAERNANKFSSDDPEHAQDYKNYAAAVQRHQLALASLNWYTGNPSETDQALLDAEVATAEANAAQAVDDLADLRAGPDSDDVKSAEARLRAAQAVVDQARIISPIDGTVMSVNHSVGDSIVPGEVEIVVADLSSLHIDTSVDELDVGDVVIGQSVEITLDALPDLVLMGSVAGIDLTPEIGSTSTQYPVRVELESLDELVRVGMTAGLSILAADEEDAVLIPNWALGFDPETGEIIVFVGEGENRERRVLVLGLRNDTVSEVLSGLEPGETISATIEERPRGNGGLFFGGG